VVEINFVILCVLVPLWQQRGIVKSSQWSVNELSNQ
jgi:hypothetical protein